MFGPEDFSLSADGQTLTCPAGQTTPQWERNRLDTGRKFRFAQQQCAGCPLREQCLAKPETRSRTVSKNDYAAEYQAAQAQARTPKYAQTRKEHPAIERKLSELVNRHDLRHARYRGQGKVRYQSLLTGLVVNLKRMVRLLYGPVAGAAKKLGAAVQGTVRAEMAG